MKTIQLRLEPDPKLPEFSRLRWDIVDVSFRDVLETGVHPWVGNNLHVDLPNALCNALNQGANKPCGLQNHQMTADIDPGSPSIYGNRTKLEMTLERIEQEVYFCEETLSFPELAEAARAKLVEDWGRGLALRLAERVTPSFPELRRFLKAAAPSVKLRGQMDLDKYNWGHLLSLDHFANHERLLVVEAVGYPNFRNRAFLDGVTDAQRRLRLKPRIDQVTLTQPGSDLHRVPLLWQAMRQGSYWRLRPNVGSSAEARAKAREFAAQWRRDSGELCFTTRTDDLVAMVESEAVQASFPNLRYTREPHPLKVQGELGRDRVSVYTLGGIPSHRSSAEHLKAILREYGASTSGVKKVLAERIAKVTAEEFARHEANLDRFFAENRFVRIARDVNLGRPLPVLEPESGLRGLLLRAYALRHLRGNVVVDPAYVNDSCTVRDLAHALIEERLVLNGGFMQIK